MGVVKTMIDNYTDLEISPTRYVNLFTGEVMWDGRGNLCGSTSTGKFCEKGSNYHYLVVSGCDYACGRGNEYGGGVDHDYHG